MSVSSLGALEKEKHNATKTPYVTDEGEYRGSFFKDSAPHLMMSAEERQNHKGDGR
jgi:hypothetical protein